MQGQYMKNKYAWLPGRVVEGRGGEEKSDAFREGTLPVRVTLYGLQDGRPLSFIFTYFLMFVKLPINVFMSLLTLDP